MSDVSLTGGGRWGSGLLAGVPPGGIAWVGSRQLFAGPVNLSYERGTSVRRLTCGRRSQGFGFINYYLFGRVSQQEYGGCTGVAKSLPGQRFRSCQIVTGPVNRRAPRRGSGSSTTTCFFVSGRTPGGDRMGWMVPTLCWASQPAYGGRSLIRNSALLGLCIGLYGGSWGGGRFLMSEVPLAGVRVHQLRPVRGRRHGH